MCSALGLMSAHYSVLGINYDFQFDHGMVVINPRKLHKWSDLPQGGQFHWQSHYGSATLVQFGCELPCGGINEAGLSIHLLEQRDAVYPPLTLDSDVLNELQWIQYHLDVSQSVDDVIASLKTIKVHRHFIPLHYVVADNFGQGAVIDFVAGQVEVTRFTENQPLLITNHSVSTSRQSIQQYRDKATGDGSLPRYSRLSEYSMSFRDGSEPELFVATGLDRVAIAGRFWDPLLHFFRGASSFRTCWQVLFLPAKKTMKFRHYKSEKGFELSLDSWDFSSLNKRLSRDFHDLQNDKAFSPYTLNDNRRIVAKTYRPYKRRLSAQMIEDIAIYPEEFSSSAEHDQI